MSDGDGGLRVATGRAEVVRELRAAGALLAGVRAPVPARPPWLTVALNAGGPGRPVALVADGAGNRPAGLAALVLRGRGVAVTAGLLGDRLPAPEGTPPARIPVRDDATADRLAAGVLALLESLRRPWTLRLTGLPMGDPTLRALGRLRPDAAFANARSARLVDELAAAGAVVRSRDPRDVEAALPALLASRPDRRGRTALRAAARLHAAIGQVEVATVTDGDRLRAGLLTLVDGTGRQPWWGWSDAGGLRTEMGAPVVTLALRGGPAGPFSRRSRAG
ncbi:hypothetical protein [Geodermatophilus sp. CPCC 206100]|uniref:hypothetical protein n=1 Tax=Geodermatophilus sp. CPCC 206100 TaxID=3020054 RepID=UPI003AFFDD51